MFHVKHSCGFPRRRTGSRASPCGLAAERNDLHVPFDEFARDPFHLLLWQQSVPRGASMANKSLAKDHADICVLVTGGAGFIGSHTCVELLEHTSRR